MIPIVITHPADADQRIDRFIRKYLPNAPLGMIFKFLRTGKIKVGGKKKDQTYRLSLGDEVQFWLNDEEMQSWHNPTKTIEIEQEKGEIDILYEDDFLMVINKPAGINVHPGDHKTTESSIIEQVQDYLQGRYDSLTFRPALVHRIDRDTSGCLLIAKDKGALEILLQDLQSHTIEKVYHALVLGTPEPRSNTIRAKLLRKENAKNEAKVCVDESGQTATTHYRTLQTILLPTIGKQEENTDTKISLLECRIETGRTHQIRVHLSHIGYPIIGDTAYGNRGINSYLRRYSGIERQLLHAYSLTFIHPKTKKKLTITAPYPKDFIFLTQEVTKIC